MRITTTSVAAGNPLDTGFAAIGVAPCATAGGDLHSSGGKTAKAMGQHLHVQASPHPEMHHLLVAVGVEGAALGLVDSDG